MPTEYFKDFSTTFNSAAVVFSKDINGLMKVDRGAAGGLKAMMNDAQNAAAVSSALDALDKISLASSNPKDLAVLPTNIKLYKAATEKLKVAKTNYVKALDEAINSKPTIKDKNGYNLPTPLKDAFPDSYRQLKLVRAEAEAVYARVVNGLAGAENLGKSDKINAEKNKAKAKVTGVDDAANDKLKAISDEAAMKQFVLAFSTSFKSSMAKGATVIQKIKAAPTVAVYNTQMNDGGRDISQNLVNIKKLKANPQFAKSSLAKKLPDPGAMATDIVPFANGNKRNLATTSSPADVKKALEEFTALYKRISSTYADVIAGKI